MAKKRANGEGNIRKRKDGRWEGRYIAGHDENGKPIRQISVSQQVIDLLIQEHEKHPDNPVMFPSPVNGGMWYPDAINRLHQRILKSAGLEHIRLHDLRHTFATVALQNGVDIKTVSSMLGHFDAGFTLRTYTHVTTKMQEQAANTMGQFIAQNM